MVKSLLFAVAATAVEAGTLAVTWDDCGAKHATVTDLQPTTIQTGSTEQVVGKGTSDEDVTSAQFNAVVKALGVKLASCSGDGTADIDCKLPLGAGTITVKAIEFPLAAGDVSIVTEVTTSSVIPASLAKVDVEIRATEQNGEDVICLNVHTKKQATLAEAKKYARGFHRMNSNAAKKVAVITDEMRAAAPASLDWAAKGALTPVKDQGQCGSCWAYSATEGIEAGVFMATGQKIKLSEQQIVSCDKQDGGCDGGDLPTAFDYVKKNGGIDTQSDYPDTSSSKGKDGKCKTNANKVVKVTDYEYAVPPCEGGACKNQKESDMMAALNTYGPLSVCVNANDWDDYSSGIYKTKCSGKYNALDHCVQLVGYDTTGSQSYWKVRNSWASDWGEKGFIRLPMGENACGIADEAMYVKAEMVSSQEEADRHCHIEEDAGMSKVVADDIFECTVNFQGTCTDCRATDATATSGGHQVSCKAGDGNWYSANCPTLAASSDRHCHIEQDAGMSKVVADDIFECTVNFQGTCTDCRATDATATSGGHQVSCKAGDGNWYSANCPTSTFTV